MVSEQDETTILRPSELDWSSFHGSSTPRPNLSLYVYFYVALYDMKRGGGENK